MSYVCWVQNSLQSVNTGEDNCLETLLQVVEASPGGCGWWRLDQYIHVMAQLMSRDMLRCIEITGTFVISVM